MPTFDEIVSISSIHPPEDLDLNLIGSLDITDITSKTLQDYFADLYDNKGVRGTLLSERKAFIVRVLKYAKQNGYIDEVPQIKLRSKRQINKFNKPDAEIIKHILIHSKGLPIETIVRLAWECGLKRAEIPTLKYNQINFDNAEIVLPDRKVPLPNCTLRFLQELKAENQVYSDYVLISQKKEAPMAEQSISNIVRSEFNKYGQKVRLSDLRVDFIFNCLKENSVEYVSYISGVNIRTLQTHYLPYVMTATEVEADKVKTVDYESIYQFMLNQEDSITGLTLWFFWQLDMPIKELPQLTWNMVDFKNAKINSISIPDKLLTLLRNLKDKNEQYSDYIFLTDNTKKPVDGPYISKVVKESFVKNGFIDFSFSQLRRNHYFLKKKLTEYLTKYRYADSGTIAKELNITGREAWKLLRELRESGEIVLIGTKYYLKGTVVSPENQETAILDYVKEHPFTTRKELSNLLGLADRRQLLPIVRPLIEEGRLIRTEGRKYCLPQDE